MNQDKSKEELKKHELQFITALIILFLLIMLISRFVLGINIGLLEGRQYQSIGYNEIRDRNVWTVAFDLFSGNLSTDGVFADGSDREIIVQSATDATPLELTVTSGEVSEIYSLNDGRMNITVPGDGTEFSLSIAGENVQNGIFNAVWN